MYVSDRYIRRASGIMFLDKTDSIYLNKFETKFIVLIVNNVIHFIVLSIMENLYQLPASKLLIMYYNYIPSMVMSRYLLDNGRL